MSCYDLSRLLFDLKMNESVYQRSLKDFESVMADYDLAPKKKTRCAPAIRASCANSACTACSVSISNVSIQSFATTFIGRKSRRVRVGAQSIGVESLTLISPTYVSADLDAFSLTLLYAV